MRGWSNLTRLLSHAHRDQPKGEARTTLERVAEHHQDLFCLTGCKPVEEAWLKTLQDVFSRENVLVELQNHLRPEDGWVASGQAELAQKCGARTVATNNVHYHLPQRRPLQDVLVAIRNRMTLEEARALLKPNSEYFLKDGAEMRAVLGAYPDALAAGYEIAQECAVSLDFKQVRFPGFPVPEGETPSATSTGSSRMAPGSATTRSRRQFPGGCRRSSTSSTRPGWPSSSSSTGT